MNKKYNIAVLTIASALFTGVLVNGSPLSVSAYDDFIVDLHKKVTVKAEVGHNFSIILTDDFQVYTFGHNNVGQLGNGTTTNSNVPINITARFNLPDGETIKDVDAGYNHGVALTTLNRIFVWGNNSSGQFGTPSPGFYIFTTPIDATTILNPDVSGSRPSVLKIEASDKNTLVLRDTTVAEAISIAGGNFSFQLGTTLGIFRNTVSLGVFNTGGEKVTDAGIYDETAYALSSTGRVATWGSDASGQLGNGGANTNSSTPTIISFTGVTSPEKVVSVATGANHSVAVTNFGSVFFWGSNAGYAIGEALPLNDTKTTPYDLTSYYNTIPADESYPIFGEDPNEDDRYWLPIGVEAGYQSTIFKVTTAYKVAPATTYTFEEWYDFFAVGTNSFGNIKGILAWRDDDVLLEPYYIDTNSYDDANQHSISFSRTNLFILDTDGDFTMYGSNVFGQQGLGFNSADVFNDDVYEESNYNRNYSYNVREFENYVYAYLPENLTAPIGDYFDVDTPERNDEYHAIYGYSSDGGSRNPGIVDYYFGEYFSDKEWELITPTQLTNMRTIFAEIFEDQVLYGWVPETNAELLTYVQDNLEDRYWLREDMEAMVNYGSWELSWDDLITLDAETIALLDVDVEPRLNDFRAILANIQDFENNFLQPFIDALTALQLSDSDLYDFVYLDEEENDLYWLDLYQDNVGQLIELGYEDDILAIFAEFESLTELEQLLLTEYYGENYEELYSEYYEYFADNYSDELSQFENEIQDFDWTWYRPLYENLSELQTLLDGIEDLNDISHAMFIEMYGQESEYFEYDMYEYWIWLNELLPSIEEGKDVFDQIVVIEDLIQNEGDGDFVDFEDAAGIIAMYNDFLDLSQNAQDLLDETFSQYGSDVYDIYLLAIEALANEVADQLWDLSGIEDDNGTYGLFANYDDVLAAIAAYEALPDEAIEILEMRQDETDYYEYLLSIKEALAEGMDVYEDIIAIEAMDLDNLSEDTIEAISSMYDAYLNLSEDAKNLLDPEHVETLKSLVLETVEGSIGELPGTVEDFDLLFNDAETKDATVNGLLGAWNQYQAMSDELKDAMDPEARAQLEALHARYLELTRPSMDLVMIGLILVHLSAGVYFAFKKRDILVKPVQ